jgi:hypothetical protein
MQDIEQIDRKEMQWKIIVLLNLISSTKLPGLERSLSVYYSLLYWHIPLCYSVPCTRRYYQVGEREGIGESFTD